MEEENISFRQSQLKNLELGRVVAKKDNEIEFQKGRLFSLQQSSKNESDNLSIEERSSSLVIDKIKDDIHIIATHIPILKDIHQQLINLNDNLIKNTNSSFNSIIKSDINTNTKYKPVTANEKKLNAITGGLSGGAFASILPYFMLMTKGIMGKAAGGLATVGGGLAKTGAGLTAMGGPTMAAYGGATGALGTAATGTAATVGSGASALGGLATAVGSSGMLPLALAGILLGTLRKKSFKQVFDSKLEKLENKDSGSKNIAKRAGITIPQLRLLQTPGRVLLRRFENNFESQLIGMQVIAIDLSRLIASELIGIRKHGFGVSDSILSQPANKVSLLKKVDIFISSIAGVGDVFTLLKSTISTPFKIAKEFQKYLTDLIEGGVDHNAILKASGLSLTQSDRAETSTERLPQLLEDTRRIESLQLEVQENIFLVIKNISKSLTGKDSIFQQTRQGETEHRIFDVFSGTFLTKIKFEKEQQKREKLISAVTRKERGIIKSATADFMDDIGRNVFGVDLGVKTTKSLSKEISKTAGNSRLAAFREEQSKIGIGEGLERGLFGFNILKHKTKQFFDPTSAGASIVSKEATKQIGIEEGDVSKDIISKVNLNDIIKESDKPVNIFEKNNDIFKDILEKIKDIFNIQIDRFDIFKKELFEKLDNLTPLTTSKLKFITPPSVATSDLNFSDFLKEIKETGDIKETKKLSGLTYGDFLNETDSLNSNDISIASNTAAIKSLSETVKKVITEPKLTTINKKSKSTITNRLNEREDEIEEDILVTSAKETSEGIKKLVELAENSSPKEGKKKGILGKLFSMLGAGVGKVFSGFKGIGKMLIIPIVTGLSAMFGTMFAGSGFISLIKVAFRKIFIPLTIATGIFDIIKNIISDDSDSNIITKVIKGMFSISDGGGFLASLKISSKYAAIGAGVGAAFGPIGWATGAIVGGAAGAILGYFGAERIGTAWDNLNTWVFETLTMPLINFIKSPFRSILDFFGGDKFTKPWDDFKNWLSDSIFTPMIEFIKHPFNSIGRLFGSVDSKKNSKIVIPSNLEKSTSKGIARAKEKIEEARKIRNDPASDYYIKIQYQKEIDLNNSRLIAFGEPPVTISPLKGINAGPLIKPEDIEEVEQKKIIKKNEIKKQLRSQMIVSSKEDNFLFSLFENIETDFNRIKNTISSNDTDIIKEAKSKIDPQIVRAKDGVDVLLNNDKVKSITDFISKGSSTISEKAIPISNDLINMLSKKFDDLGEIINQSSPTIIPVPQSSSINVPPANQQSLTDDTINDTELSRFSELQDKIVQDLFSLTPGNLTFNLKQASGREDYNLFPI